MKSNVFANLAFELTTRLAKAIPIMSRFVAISSPDSELLVKSDAFDLGSSTHLPLTIANRLCPEVTLNSSYTQTSSNDRLSTSKFDPT